MGASMRLRLVLALLCLAAAPPALAQQEPPARVGTVSYVSGNLAFHTAGDTQWSASGVNYPVATGGSFWTDPQARAQIQIGPSTIVMDGGTEIDVTNLNEQVAQLGVPQGRVHLHLRQLEAGQSFEIDLPQGAVWLLQPGSYDINAGSQDQGARVAVFAGSARFVGGGTDLGIHSGDAAMLSQTNPATVSTERAGSDAFVQWCTAHDYQENRLASPHYVSAQMTGYSDLDPYGNWQSNPQYGQMWYPSQTPADWAPYRDGRWIWVAPWGWTWVDQQPWGFAPFHYGRWAYVDDRWGWVPGSYVAQPVYAPALVAFVGLAAAGIAESAGAGPAVGWFPLAPGEVYWPSYTRNTAYIRNVNITNVKNINTVVNNTVINESHGARAAASRERQFCQPAVCNRRPTASLCQCRTGGAGGRACSAGGVAKGAGRGSPAADHAGGGARRGRGAAARSGKRGGARPQSTRARGIGPAAASGDRAGASGRTRRSSRRPRCAAGQYGSFAAAATRRSPPGRAQSARPGSAGRRDGAAWRAARRGATGAPRPSRRACGAPGEHRRFAAGGAASGRCSTGCNRTRRGRAWRTASRGAPRASGHAEHCRFAATPSGNGRRAARSAPAGSRPHPPACGSAGTAAAARCRAPSSCGAAAGRPRRLTRRPRRKSCTRQLRRHRTRQPRRRSRAHRHPARRCRRCIRRHRRPPRIRRLPRFTPLRPPRIRHAPPPHPQPAPAHGGKPPPKGEEKHG